MKRKWPRAAIPRPHFGKHCMEMDEVRQRATATLAESNGRDAEYVVALALAMIGDSALARGLSR